MRVGLPNSLYKYPSLQHYLNVCYKDCAKMDCAMCDMAFRAGLELTRFGGHPKIK